jgi:heme ABC exporter ATP-binding subunit CcmA
MPMGAADAGRLSLHRVSKSFGRRAVVRDVSLDVGAGRVLAVLGPNGAGKSTLLRIAAGIIRPDAGEVRIEEQPVGDPRTRRRIGCAGHTSFLYGHLTVEENLRLYARLYGLRGDHVEERLAAFDLMAHRGRPVRELSRGLVQRASLARALLHDPAVLLLDEPFTGLDAEASRTLRALIADWRSRGRTVVMATHAWGEARDLADEAVVLVAGRLALREEAAALDGDRVAAAYQTA